MLRGRLENCPPARMPWLLRQLFHARTGKWPEGDFATLNEKIIWAMMFDATALKCKCADKFRVREYVAEKVGEKYLPALYGVYDSPDEIDLADLPKKFIFQFNAGTGRQKIVLDKSALNMAELVPVMRGWIARKYWAKTAELQYKSPPKIVARELLDIRLDREFRIYCIGGKVQFIMHRSYERGKAHIGLRYYGRDWGDPGFAPAMRGSKFYAMKPITKPETMDEMIELAEKLATPFEFVCADFYELAGGGVKFGELTFASFRGTLRFVPNIPTQLKYGALFKLPRRDKDGFSAGGRANLA